MEKVYRIVETSLSILNIFAVKKIWLDLEKYVEWHVKDFVKYFQNVTICLFS